MAAPIISVENLSKRYLVGHRADRGAPYQYTALRDVLGRELRNAAKKAVDVVRGRPVVQGDAVEEFWALKDVSFEVQQGEVLGIIGRNGAGKSTLLKILSRITEPTAGRVTLRGRVASLLEVGTGFHPELTGRENIFLNGAILGMSRAEIRKKFDEIVAFAEVEKFLDTPVKRYSSGMYVRLAFAVAAHLEPEILIVDEVLAVGDAEFQKKCLGKMDEVSRRQGRTVLFVSHNMAAVQRLCRRTVWLEKGDVIAQGTTSDVRRRYLSSGTSEKIPEIDLREYRNRYGSGDVKITSARLLDHEGKPSSILYRLRPATLELSLIGNPPVAFNVSAVCMSTDGIKILQLDHHDTVGFCPSTCHNKCTIRASIPSLPLQCGQFSWAIGIHTLEMNPIDVVLEILPFEVDDDMLVSPRRYRSTSENGFCSLIAQWEIAAEVPTNAGFLRLATVS